LKYKGTHAKFNSIIFAVSLLDALAILFPPGAPPAVGLFCLVEAEYLSGDDRALSVEFDWHHGSLRTTLRLIRNGKHLSWVRSVQKLTIFITSSIPKTYVQIAEYSMQFGEHHALHRRLADFQDSEYAPHNLIICLNLPS
jgi:hypothetical protein